MVLAISGGKTTFPVNSDLVLHAHSLSGFGMQKQPHFNSWIRSSKEKQDWHTDKCVWGCVYRAQSIIDKN